MKMVKVYDDFMEHIIEEPWFIRKVMTNKKVFKEGYASNYQSFIPHHLVKEIMDVNEQDESGDTILHSIIKSQKIFQRGYDFLEFFIKAGANPNIKNSEELTARDCLEIQVSEDESFRNRRYLNRWVKALEGQENCADF